MKANYVSLKGWTVEQFNERISIGTELRETCCDSTYMVTTIKAAEEGNFVSVSRVSSKFTSTFEELEIDEALLKPEPAKEELEWVSMKGWTAERFNSRHDVGTVIFGRTSGRLHTTYAPARDDNGWVSIPVGGGKVRAEFYEVREPRESPNVPRKYRTAGSAEGLITVGDKFDEPLSEFDLTCNKYQPVPTELTGWLALSTKADLSWALQEFVRVADGDYSTHYKYGPLVRNRSTKAEWETKPNG